MEKEEEEEEVEEEEEDDDDDEAASEGRREKIKRRALVILNLSLSTDLRREPSSWPIDCQLHAHDVAIA